MGWTSFFFCSTAVWVCGVSQACVTPSVTRKLPSDYVFVSSSWDPVLGDCIAKVALFGFAISGAIDVVASVATLVAFSVKLKHIVGVNGKKDQSVFPLIEAGACFSSHAPAVLFVQTSFP